MKTKELPKSVRLLLNDLCEKNIKASPRVMIEIGYMAGLGRNKDLSDALRFKYEELEKAAQQNKELREDYDQLLNVLEIKEIESKAEIQRLTKEVELLKLESDVAFTKVKSKNEELTRLRELLDESKDLLLIASTGYPQIEFLERVKKLITEIENALNHKP